jgi:AraC family transcriptional regulator of adaptative response/methylated-DNA-[protein]-cysteine methyltransferase
MTNLNQLSADYERIEQAIVYLENNSIRQPDLREVASHLGLSEYHFQRLFSRWAGISPKRFMQYLTKEKAKQLLIDFSVMDTTYHSGLSSPGRLHDLFVNVKRLPLANTRPKVGE